LSTAWLHIQAPFAAWRWLQAGVYRASSPMMPPSAAWGLVLNLAGIDTRGEDTGAVTDVRRDAPTLRLALGLPGRAPELGTLYQQLHTYPVGGSGKERKELTHGAKYWVAPTRREIMIGIDVVIGVADPEGGWATRVADGLAGRLPRYGLPFCGDNNLLVDRAELLSEPPPCRWYAVVDGRHPGRAEGSCRLTTRIHRTDAGRTQSLLMAPTVAQARPPEGAWVDVGPLHD
jgi:CRISPR-associated protein Cas5t